MRQETVQTGFEPFIKELGTNIFREVLKKWGKFKTFAIKGGGVLAYQFFKIIL